MSEPADTLDELVAREILSAGFYVERVVRVYPPQDSGDPAEVLFLGKPNPYAGKAEPFTALIGDERPPIVEVTPGW